MEDKKADAEEKIEEAAEEQENEQDEAQSLNQGDDDSLEELLNEDSLGEELAEEEIIPVADPAPGFTEGPDGTVRNPEGKVAYAPPGSHNAAMAGVQQDASGHVESLGLIHSDKSGTRI